MFISLVKPKPHHFNTVSNIFFFSWVLTHFFPSYLVLGFIPPNQGHFDPLLETPPFPVFRRAYPQPAVAYLWLSPSPCMLASVTPKWTLTETMSDLCIPSHCTYLTIVPSVSVAGLRSSTHICEQIEPLCFSNSQNRIPVNRCHRLTIAQKNDKEDCYK